MRAETKVLIVMMMFAASMSMASVSSWTPIYEGVWTATGYKTSPRLMRAYAVRVDTWNSNVSMFATPHSGPYETTLQTPPAFRSAYNLEVAVNANWFQWHTPYADNIGLVISNGTLVSEFNPTYKLQLRFTQGMVASLVENATNPSGIYTAVGGHELVLENGTITGADNNDAQPRTLMGLCEDARYLVMVVVDGRQSGYSLGADYYESGQWLQDFGAYNGGVFDGGGSSCLCTASGGVLNSPSGGYPRAVGANLGVNSVAVSAYPRRMLEMDWYLNNSNTDGYHDITEFSYGTSGDVALAGDWDGDGDMTPGVVYIYGSNLVWHLKNSNNGGSEDISFGYGLSTDIPIVGDWDGDGDDTAGVFRPSNRTFYLRNSNTAGSADITAVYGTTTDWPVAGDWDGDGDDTIGIFRPSDRSWHLNDTFDGTAEYSFGYGAIGDYPVVGDWDGDGTWTVGIRRTGAYYLRNTNSAGSADITQAYGNSSGTPVVGDWDGNGTVTIGIIQ